MAIDLLPDGSKIDTTTGEYWDAAGTKVEREPDEVSAVDLAHRDAAKDESMFAQLDHTAVGWRPVPGAKIIGELVGRFEIDEESAEYGAYPVLEIRTDSGAIIAVHGFHTALKSQIRKRNPQLGDRVGIVYNGFRDNAPGAKFKGYEDYNMIVRRPAPKE